MVTIKHIIQFVTWKCYGILQLYYSFIHFSFHSKTFESAYPFSFSDKKARLKRLCKMSDGDENLVYLTFKDQRPCWLLIAFAVPISLISSIGILLNFSVIYVTFKSKNLDGVANYLLALTSFFEVLQQFGSFLFLYTAISGTNFIDYSLAVQICALSLFGFGGVPICMFFTGVDRLICILAPIWHNSLRKRYYLGTILAICNFCGIMTALLFFKTAMDIPNLKLTGELSGLVYVRGDAGKYFSIYSFVFYSLTIAIYVVTGVWIKFRAQGGTTPNNQTNRRIFRSLFIIILMNIGGYFLMTICENFVLPKNTFASVWAWAFKKIVALPLNVSASSSAVILYVTSNEYRKAFGDEFGKVMKLLAFRNRNATAAASAMQIRHVQPALTVPTTKVDNGSN